jgi:hypothetical protein
MVSVLLPGVGYSLRAASSNTNAVLANAFVCMAAGQEREQAS